MRICVDLDGVICETRQAEQTYENVLPKVNAIESIKQLKKDGHHIIVYTARHMKTCNNNVGEIMAKQGKILIEWLDKYEIPYDEIHIGKVLADLYIDDRGLRFENNWPKILKEIKEHKYDTD